MFNKGFTRIHESCHECGTCVRQFAAVCRVRLCCTDCLVAHGVGHVDAQRFVCNAIKGRDHKDPPTGIFELYGRGGLSRAARSYRGLNVRGLEVLGLRGPRTDIKASTLHPPPTHVNRRWG